MKLHFQNRLAVFNTIAGGVIITIIFIIIYVVIYITDKDHLYKDLLFEKTRILNSKQFKNDTVVQYDASFTSSVTDLAPESNPVYVQLTDSQGKRLSGMPQVTNGDSLFGKYKPGRLYQRNVYHHEHFLTGYFPVYNSKGGNAGYLSIAISAEESSLILHNLLLILCLSYPLVLVGLYFLLQLSVSKAIAPVRKLIKTAAAINDSNIGIRMALPEKEDEIFQLANTFNELLDRLEKSMRNQKQFTADASHEMRTPLTAIRGILEIAIRKQRTPEHYVHAIKDAISEVDRMHLLMEQLLQLARLNAGVVTANRQQVDINKQLDALAKKWDKKLREKHIILHRIIDANKKIHSNGFLLEVILENLLSNAIKYGREDGNIYLEWSESKNELSITDDGYGIPAEHLPHLFDRFYRADTSRNSRIPGHGLGLSIVHKMANLLKISISVTSSEGEGTSFILHF